MADAQVLEASGSGQTASTTTWVDVAEIAAASFTANKKYLILAFAQAQHASSANETRLRLVHGETPTEFTDAYDAEEMLANTSHVAPSWMYVFTQGGTTERVRIQVSSSSTTTVTVEWGHIIAINLDDIGTDGTDYHYNENTTDTGITTSGANHASVTFTPNGTDRWLYFGAIAWIPGSATAQTNVMLDVNGSLFYEASEEGEDTATETRNRLFIWSEVPANASMFIRMRTTGETSAGTHLSSRVLALNLSKFAQASATSSGSVGSPTALTEGAGWINLATLSVTPTTTGDFILLGSMMQDYNAATNAQPEGRLQVNPDGGGLVSRPNYGDDGLGPDTWDGTDQRNMVLFDVVSLTSGASRTINLDARMANTGTADPQIYWRTLAYISKALAGGGPIERTASDTVTISESVTRAFTGARTTADTLTLSESISRTGTVFRRATSNTLTLSESISRAGTVFRRATANTVTTSDVAARVATLLRSATDAVTTSDTATRVATLFRTVTDAVSASQVAAGFKVIVRTAVDSITTSDVATRVGTFLRATSDSVTTADAVAFIKLVARSATDAVTMSDSATRAKTAVRTVSDSVTTSDAAVRVATLVRTATDSVTTSDTAARILTAIRSVTDSVSATQTATRVTTAVRAVTDAVTTSDVATGLKVILRSAVDAITLSDSAARQATLVRSTADSVTASQVAARVVTAVRAVTDSVTLSDVATGVRLIIRSAVDTVTTSDVATRSKTVVRTAVDALSTSDTAARVVSATRTASDALGLSDVATRGASLFRTAVDAVTTADAAVQSFGSALRNRGATTARTFINSIGRDRGGTTPR